MARKSVEELRGLVQGLVDNGASVVSVADEIGYSRSQVSSFTGGKDVSDRFLNKLREYFETVEDYETPTLKTTKDLEFRMTKDAKNIIGILVMTERFSGFSAIIGSAGTGKTEAVKHYVNNLSEQAVYIRCNHFMSVRDILRDIGKACGIMLQVTSKSDMFNDLVDHLIAHPKMLVFDEVDQIMPHKNINKIETIRNLHDVIKSHGSSVVIVGSPSVEYRLKQKRSVAENYGQLDSRIDYMYKTQGLQESEILEIVSEFDINEAAKMQVTELILKTTKGGIRWLTKVLEKCIDISRVDDGRITKDTVKEATQIMMI
jgi:DNA transposition AAA+ family ATPase